MLRNDTASTASSDDYQSVNLLLQNSPSIASLLPSPEKFAPSPATQTLDHLSQSTLPEHLMVMSPSPSLLARLELNAVTTLASVRSQSSPADFSYLLEEAQDQDQDDSSRIEKDTKPRSKKKSKKKPPSSKSTTAPTATASSTTTTGTGSRRRMSEEPSGRRTPDHKTAATATATSKTNRKTTTTKKNKKTKSFTTPTAKASSINNNHRKKSSPGLGRVVEKYSKAGQLLGTYSSLRNAEGATGVIRKYITACCQGTEELAGGFRWKFADDDERDMTAMANATTTTTTTTATSSSKTTKKATKKAAKKSHLTSPAIRLQKKQNKSNTTKSSTPSPGFREKRPVEQWENGHCVATFDSLTRAEFATRVSRKQISKCCDGLLGKAGGFIWKYSEQTTTENTTTAKKSSKTASPQVANKKRSVAKKKTEASLEAKMLRVLQQWKGRRLVSSFSSAEEAADKTGISLRLLLEACQRGRGEVDGYQWKYASSENIENAKHSSREESKKRGRSPKGRDYQDGNGSQGRRQSSKHRDRQQDGREGRPDGREKKAIAHKQQEERKPKRRRKSRGKNRARAVQQWTIKGSLVETFPSMLQAEEITAVPRASIRLCCLGERSEAGGYVWKYCEEERSTEDAETDPTDPAEAGKGTSPTPIPRETESGQEQYSVRKERATAVATRSEGTSSPPPDDTCETYYHKTQGRTRKEQTSPVVDKIQPQKAKDHHALVPRPEANETTPPRLGESKGQKNYSSWKVGFKGETTFELGEVLSHANTKLDIEVLSCHIDRSGSLGLTIEHATPRNLKLGEIFGTACIVQTVRSGGLGERSGIQIGDCLLLEKEGGVLESEYYSIRNAASSGRRPLAFCVIRDRKVESSKKKAIDMELEQATQAHKTSKNRNVEAPEKGGTTIPEASEAAEKVHWTGSKEAAFKTEKAVGSKSITTAQVNPAGTKQKPSSVQAVKVATTGESTSTRKNSIVRSPSAVSTAQKTDKAADFCKYCNGRSKYQVHHSWCLHHPDFEKSGAKERLEEIRGGIELGCRLCLLEYKKGRILNDCKSERHSAACQKNKQRIREEKKESSDNEEKDPAVIHPVEKQTRKRANDGASHPTSKRLRTSSVRTQKEEGEEPAAKSQILEASIGTSEDKTKGRRSSRSANLQARRPVSNLPSIQSARRNLVTPMMQKQEDETESEVEDNSNDKLEITWESCLNPWGRESSLEEDVVVFSSAKGIGESERMLPSARFEMHPFSGGSRYQNTHHSPEEGFQAIVLQRDTLENSSWGFTVCRHDFGGACLVSSVVPFSPADTAVYMGESSFSSSSLRANDMIIAVNGKTIGGMTVATLEIELETGGTKLNLLVSRFKPADRVKQRLQDLEARFIAAFDNDVNNENLLHWVDLGARSISGLKNSSHATVTQKAPVHVSHEREDKETTGANDHDRVAADEDDTSRASSMENNTNSMQQGSPRIAAVETRVYEDHWGQIETTPEKDDSIEPQAQFEAHSAQFEAVDETYEDTSLERSNAPSISHGVEGQHDDQGLYTKHIRFSNEVGSVRPTAPWESVNEGNASTTSDDETGEEIPIENASGDKFLRVAAESSSPLSSRSSVSTCRGSPPKAGSDEDFEDDGNAWCGCVCGVIHGDKDEHEVFWVQCEGCKSWFNVYTGCVHFDQANAQYVKDWHCWGCEEVSTDSQNELSADGLQNELEPNVIEESPTDGACMAGASVQEKNARKLASSVHSPSLDEHTGSNDSSPSRAGHLSTSPASKKAKNAPLSSRFRPDGSITPRSTPTLNRDGTYKKPRGLPPNGYHWDVDSGLWVVDQKTRQHVDAEPTTPSRRPSNDDSHDKKRMTEPEDTASGTDESLVESCVVFKVGELVEIREHAWAGVNNPAGAAYVKDVYRNQGGKLLYDIKYVVGQSTKGVFASYVKAHSFL